MPTKQQCQDWGDAIRRQCESFYGPRLEAVRNLISEAVAKGQDPKKVQLEDGIATIDYEALLKDNESAKKQAQEAAETQQKSCDDGAAPNWIGDAQKMTDGALVVAMLPFLVLTQRYASMKIDLFEVYKGRPLGGDNALIPKVREEILNALGIDGKTAALLRDPVNVVQDGVKEALKNAGEVVDNIFPDLPPIPLPQFPPIPLPQFPPLPKIF